MLHTISKSFLYAALFSVIVVLTSTFFPFIGGKDYFFRTAVQLSLIFFVLWWAFEARPGVIRERLMHATRQPLFIAVSLFVFVFLLATVFAFDSHVAFWSNFERGEGGFQMIHYYLFFVLLIVLFRDWKDWKWGFLLAALAASLMILYGVFAQLGIAKTFISPYAGAAEGTIPTTFWGLLTKTRFQGSLGNPAYVAPHIMFAMFFAIYLGLSQRWRNKKAQIATYTLLSLFFLFFFILSQTKGAFLGLVAATFVFLGYLVFKMPTVRKQLVVIMLALAILGSVAYVFRDTPFIKSLPGSRLLQITLGERTIQTRLWTWGSAWQGFLERPVLGWGPENFNRVFDKYFNPGHFIPNAQSETWFDRAHSVFFDYLAETGILGFLSFLGIFGTFYWQFFARIWKNQLQENTGKRSDNQSQPPESVFSQALLFSMPIGYLVQGLAIFDVLPIYVPLFLFFAFSTYRFNYHGNI